MPESNYKYQATITIMNNAKTFVICQYVLEIKDINRYQVYLIGKKFYTNARPQIVQREENTERACIAMRVSSSNHLLCMPSFTYLSNGPNCTI